MIQRVQRAIACGTMLLGRMVSCLLALVCPTNNPSQIRSPVLSRTLSFFLLLDLCNPPGVRTKGEHPQHCHTTGILEKLFQRVLFRSLLEISLLGPCAVRTGTLQDLCRLVCASLMWLHHFGPRGGRTHTLCANFRSPCESLLKLSRKVSVSTGCVSAATGARSMSNRQPSNESRSASISSNGLSPFYSSVLLRCSHHCSQRFFANSRLLPGTIVRHFPQCIRRQIGWLKSRKNCQYEVRLSLY